MKLRVKLVNGYQDWNLNDECRRTVRPIAKAFGVSMEEFLRLYSRNELPNQQNGDRALEKCRVPRGFLVNLGNNSRLSARLERAAKFGERSINQFVWGAIAGSIDCHEEDMIFDPKTGEPIGDGCGLSKFHLGSLRRMMPKVPAPSA